MPGLDLGRHVEFRRARDLGCAARRLAQRIPGRIVDTGVGGVRHQLVIGRVKLDLIAAKAARVKSPQFWRIFVGDAAPRRHCRRAPMAAEFRQFGMRRAALIHGYRLDQRPIQREQIDILERRRLVEYLMGRRRRHGQVHRSVRAAEQNRRWISLLPANIGDFTPPAWSRGAGGKS
jgi:hypothetical protein